MKRLFTYSELIENIWQKKQYVDYHFIKTWGIAVVEFDSCDYWSKKKRRYLKEWFKLNKERKEVFIKWFYEKDIQNIWEYEVFKTKRTNTGDDDILIYIKKSDLC
jgi:hypothetical protein